MVIGLRLALALLQVPKLLREWLLFEPHGHIDPARALDVGSQLGHAVVQGVYPGWQGGART